MPHLHFLYSLFLEKEEETNSFRHKVYELELMAYIYCYRLFLLSLGSIVSAISSEARTIFVLHGVYVARIIVDMSNGRIRYDFLSFLSVLIL